MTSSYAYACYQIASIDVTTIRVCDIVWRMCLYLGIDCSGVPVNMDTAHPWDVVHYIVMCRVTTVCLLLLGLVELPPLKSFQVSFCMSHHSVSQ